MVWSTSLGHGGGRLRLRCGDRRERELAVHRARERRPGSAGQAGCAEQGPAIGFCHPAFRALLSFFAPDCHRPSFPPRLCPEAGLKKPFSACSSSARLLSSDKNKTIEMRAPMSLFEHDKSAERLPVSLITGFLGSGKTTLLNRAAAPRRHEGQRRHHQRIRRSQSRPSPGRARRWRGGGARERLYLLHNPQRSRGDAAHTAGEARSRRGAAISPYSRRDHGPGRSCPDRAAAAEQSIGLAFPAARYRRDDGRCRQRSSSARPSI